MEERLAWVEKLLADGRKEHALSLLKVLVFQNPENDRLQEKLAELAQELAPTPPPLPDSTSVNKTKNPSAPPLPTPTFVIPKAESNAAIPEPPPLPTPTLILPKIEGDSEATPPLTTPPLPDPKKNPPAPTEPSPHIPPPPPLPETGFNFEVRKPRKKD
jgi:hypothetical protein